MEFQNQFTLKNPPKQNEQVWVCRFYVGDCADQSGVRPGFFNGNDTRDTAAVIAGLMFKFTPEGKKEAEFKFLQLVTEAAQ